MSIEVIAVTCTHETTCPSAASDDARAACVVAEHWEQGWAVLCNGLIVFDDGAVITPNVLPAA